VRAASWLENSEERYPCLVDSPSCETAAQLMQDHTMAVDTYRKAVDALIAARMHRKSLDERLRLEGQVSDARFECEERHLAVIKHMSEHGC
jgi:hypothetical protein